MTSWATPLLVLPGVSLLVMSTSVRYARLHDELHRLLDHGDHHGVERLMARGRLFRDALVALYLSCSLLAVAGLAGGLELPDAISYSLSASGIAALVGGCVLLTREAMASLDVLRADAERGQHHDS